MYLSCAGVPQNETGKLLHSQYTKVNYYQFRRDIGSHHLLATPGLFQFGGPGVVVQTLPLNVLPGSTMHTDGWRAYSGLGRQGYVHHAVSHSKNFVDSLSGTDTNAVEAYWSRLKAPMRRQGEQPSALIDTNGRVYVEGVYANGSMGDTFASSLKHLRAKFPLA